MVDLIAFFKRWEGRRKVPPAARPVAARPQGAARPQVAARPKVNGTGKPVRAASPQSRATRSYGADPRAPQRDYLAVHGVEKSFGSRQVVRGVSLYVRRGEVVGLLGPNGAGKTTCFYMITGLIGADYGAI